MSRFPWRAVDNPRCAAPSQEASDDSGRDMLFTEEATDHSPGLRRRHRCGTARCCHVAVAVTGASGLLLVAARSCSRQPTVAPQLPRLRPAREAPLPTSFCPAAGMVCTNPCTFRRYGTGHCSLPGDSFQPSSHANRAAACASASALNPKPWAAAGAAPATAGQPPGTPQPNRLPACFVRDMVIPPFHKVSQSRSCRSATVTRSESQSPWCSAGCR